MKIENNKNYLKEIIEDLTEVAFKIQNLQNLYLTRSNINEFMAKEGELNELTCNNDNKELEKNYNNLTALNIFITEIIENIRNGGAHD